MFYRKHTAFCVTTGEMCQNSSKTHSNKCHINNQNTGHLLLIVRTEMFYGYKCHIKKHGVECSAFTFMYYDNDKDGEISHEPGA